MPYIDRNEANKRIRAALKRKTGKTWSVSGSRGTAWGWIDISSPPRRRNAMGYMSDADRKELAELLGLDEPEDLEVALDVADPVVVRLHAGHAIRQDHQPQFLLRHQHDA